jgi:hypothetical protein
LRAIERASELYNSGLMDVLFLLLLPLLLHSPAIQLLIKRPALGYDPGSWPCETIHDITFKLPDLLRMKDSHNAVPVMLLTNENIHMTL